MIKNNRKKSNLQKKKHNKFVLITGGLGFLGSFFSEVLINKKFKVIILDKNNPKTEKQKKLVKKSYLFQQMDITSEIQIIDFLKKIKKNQIKIDYLINNAAVDSVPKKLSLNSHLPDIKTWNYELSVSLTGSYLMIKYFGEEMAKRKFGKIVNIGSDFSVIAPNQDLYSDYKNFLKPVTYSVIKHGMLGMTRYFASLYSKKNIQVNMLSPGPVFNNQKNVFVKKLLKFIPMKRMARKDDLNEAMLFLLNDNNSYYTGQNLIVDGGRTII
jgi:NAD(P)-dependent dehydrogenase (short-subunit alcohol dehydrogenase family)|tara:strand:- start:1633 stop:2439 length:807 start_codon:yes stop_codon:yes gene_type:complete